jgi:hypothetical protein
MGGCAGRPCSATSTAAAVLALPVGAWEFAVGAYMLVKGFKPAR